MAVLKRCLPCAALALLACADERIDAVTGYSCAERPEQAACARPEWPNEHSHTNSDAWLEAHADGLRVLRPRVLVLDFHNPLSLEAMRAVVDEQVDALAEGSRYHAYAVSDAPAFLRYEPVKLVDLRDTPAPADWAHTSSTLVPLDESGAFDVAALFEEPYTSHIGLEDPDGDGRLLGMCELFERGLVHEVWLAVGDTAPGREPFPMIECKVARDESGRRGDGPSVATSGGDACSRLPPCGVTMRIAHLSPLRGVGCDLFVRGWGIQGSLAAIPYLRRNAARFFNADLDQRYGAPAASFLSLCGEEQTPCLAYPTPTTVEGIREGGPAFRLEGFGQGCGSVEFAPNSAFAWDFESATAVQTRCEHYGLRDGTDSQDQTSPYSFATVSSWAQDYPDCGGAWQIYLRQSMPGLDNVATGDDGQPMKNWWPFLFF